MQLLDGIDKPYRIFSETVDPKALEQFREAMLLDTVVQGALMPDVHVGYTLPIGAVVAVKDYIYPSFVGYDIGCGMCAVPTTFPLYTVKCKAQSIFKGIYDNIPVGFNHNQHDSVWDKGCSLPGSDYLADIFQKNGLRQLGSLGGGNHFIEIGYDEREVVWIIIHSGSRGIGHAVATHYMKLASGDGKAREGHFGFEVDSDNGRDYLMDMNFCLEFALENRLKLVRKVASQMIRFCQGEVTWRDLINRNHNHAELKDGLWIHRKGATHAEAGMMGVIPGNMKYGSFIVEGKGYAPALWSSSHGAGRVLGRKAAQQLLNLEEFKATMGDIVAKVDAETLDESPLAYKDIFEVIRQQADMIEIKHYVRPIINVKG
jgi:tRNA-splicing ligase RtcB